MPTAERKKNPSSLADRDPSPMKAAIPEYEYSDLPEPIAIAWLNSQDQSVPGVALAINQKSRLRLESGESVSLDRIVQWDSWSVGDRVEIQSEQEEGSEFNGWIGTIHHFSVTDFGSRKGEIVPLIRIDNPDSHYHYFFEQIHKAVESSEIVPQAESELETEIDQLYRELTETEQTAIAAARATVQHYKLLGEKLAIQKKQLGHGNWLPWLKEHGIDENRAKRALKISKEWDAIASHAQSNQSDVNDLTLTEVLGILYPHKKTDPETRALSPEGRSFEEVQELFKPWGSFDRNPAGGTYKYVLSGCRGGDRHFKGLDSAARWHSEYCREDNRLDAPERPKSQAPVSGAAPFAPPPIPSVDRGEEEPEEIPCFSPNTQLDETQAELSEAVDGLPPPDKSTHARQVMTSSKSDEHYTPQEVLECVYACFAPLGGVQLDPCSNAIGDEANVIAEGYFTISDDGLAQDWTAATMYINPPYSDVAAWVEKAVKAYDAGSVKEILLLVKADPSTQWFQRIWFNATAVCFVNHRLRFLNESNDGNGATFPSAIAYFGSEIDRFYHAFESLGAIVQVINPEMFGE